MNVHMIISHFNPFFSKAITNILIQIKENIPIISTLTPDANSILNTAVLVFTETYKGSWIPQYFFITGNGFKYSCFNILGRALISGRKNPVYTSQRFAAVVNYSCTGYITVRNIDRNIVKGIKLCIKQTNRFYDAVSPSNFNIIPGLKGL